MRRVSFFFFVCLTADSYDESELEESKKYKKEPKTMGRALMGCRLLEDPLHFF